MEEDTTPSRRNDSLLLGGMRTTRSSSMRFTEPQGRTEELLVPPHRSTRSYAPPTYTLRYSAYGFIILSEEEEKKLSRLEKRLVANVDFDDQALNSLGFGTDIYYMLGHLGWVKFFNGVSANTHEEFSLEILMTMAPILDEGGPSLSFRLKGIQQVVPYEHIRELLGFQKGALEKVDVPEGMLDGFWNLISGEAHQQWNSIRNPIEITYTHIYTLTPTPRVKQNMPSIHQKNTPKFKEISLLVIANGERGHRKKVYAQKA
jgi:hypothetical protein